MCGIVGYIGERDAQGILTSGLRRLEYHGYDSAGITTIDNIGQATLLCKKGNVSQLFKLVLSHENHDKVGIGILFEQLMANHQNETLIHTKLAIFI